MARYRGTLTRIASTERVCPPSNKVAEGRFAPFHRQPIKRSRLARQAVMQIELVVGLIELRCLARHITVNIEDDLGLYPHCATAERRPRIGSVQCEIDGALKCSQIRAYAQYGARVVTLQIDRFISVVQLVLERVTAAQRSCAANQLSDVAVAHVEVQVAARPVHRCVRLAREGDAEMCCC